jgi:lipopolysaccharide heptosyltransferase II
MDTEKILVRGVNWLGDAIMTLPALQRLREARPRARITLLTPEKLAALWGGQPMIDNVMAFAPAETAWRMGRRLRAEHFDVAVAFPNSTRSALELWLAGVPRRIGAARGWRNLFLTDALPPRRGAVPMRKRSEADVRQALAMGLAAPAMPSRAHHVHDYLYLASHLGALTEPVPPSLFVSPGQIEAACAKFAIGGADVWFGLNPGAEYGPAKRWPAERFIEAAVTLRAQTACRWLIFGGAGDVELTEGIARAIQSASGATAAMTLAGKTTLGELAALFTRCRVVLTNDTGPMHLAAAVGAPVVVLFGSTSPELTGPIFSGNAKILRAPPPCAPCFRRDCPIDLRCLTAITTAQVVDAVRETFN